MDTIIDVPFARPRDTYATTRPEFQEIALDLRRRLDGMA
jgi:hypothetical protein